MKVKKFLAATAVSIAAATSAQAALVDVFSKENAIVPGLGAAAGFVTAGQLLTISVAVDDLWKVGVTRLGEPTRTGNADGMSSLRLKTFLGQTFNHGTLVGRIGGGAFFEVGTYFSGIVAATGALELFAWDKNFVDNRGKVTADVVIGDIAPIPLPAGAPLLLAGLGGLALMRRRKA